MRFISFLPLLLLFCTSISSGLTGNSTSKVENHLETKTKSNRTLINFTDFNDNVKYLILERVGFMDLTFLAEAIPSTYNLVLEVMRRIGHEVVICHDDEVLKTRKYEQNIPSKSVDLYDIELTSNILKKYGSALRWISVSRFYPNTNQSDNVSHLINQYATESLTHLSLGYILEDTFEQFTEPFKKVEVLTFVVQTNEVNSGPMTLNELFPSLTRLHMRLKSSVDYSFIDFEFPQLDSICIEGSSEVAEHRDQIENFLRKNPQVRRLEWKSMPNDFNVRSIANILPNVEVLTVDTFNVGANTVQMEHVRKFSVWDVNSESIRRLWFPALRSLETKYLPENLNMWIEFFQRHPNVTDLYVFHPLSWETVSLVELTAHLPNLVNMHLGCTNYITFETLSQFINDHAQLMELKFSIYRFNDEDLVKLRDRFESEWNFRKTSDKWILERLDRDA